PDFTGYPAFVLSRHADIAEAEEFHRFLERPIRLAFTDETDDGPGTAATHRTGRTPRTAHNDRTVGPVQRQPACHSFLPATAPPPPGPAGPPGQPRPTGPTAPTTGGPSDLRSVRRPRRRDLAGRGVRAVARRPPARPLPRPALRRRSLRGHPRVRRPAVQVRR